MSEHNEMDYCDLDPTKLCDNCCRCIESGEDYEEFQLEQLTDTISTLDELAELPFDFDGEDDEYVFDSSDVAPLEIDPQLMAEWEKKLRIYEIEEAQQLVRSLHGTRRKRDRD